MPVAVPVSLQEYLETSHRPDCDYLDGELLERNVGEWDHSRLQSLLCQFLCSQEREWGILVVPEQRVQVKPDITVIAGPRPDGGIITKPPFLCIEILSPSDRFSEMQDRVDDYLNFGVQYVWLIEPQTGRAFIHTANGVTEVRDGILTATKPDIRVSLNDLGRAV